MALDEAKREYKACHSEHERALTDLDQCRREADRRVEEEREACAMECDRICMEHKKTHLYPIDMAGLAKEGAAASRARSTAPAAEEKKP